MRRSMLLSIALAFPLLVPAQSPGAAGRASAKAELKDPKGNVVGTAEMSDTERGLLLRIAVKGLSPGPHAFHVHQTGKCAPPDFMSAGGHFNPEGKSHGYLNAHGEHAGDLPNLQVDKSGNGNAEFHFPGLMVSTGKAALLDQDGSALVIHAKPDDYRSDPAGLAGDRIACGVVERAK
jgi:Cu-Zn family superoxide dismutase